MTEYLAKGKHVTIHGKALRGQATVFAAFKNKMAIDNGDSKMQFITPNDGKIHIGIQVDSRKTDVKIKYTTGKQNTAKSDGTYVQWVNGFLCICTVICFQSHTFHLSGKSYAHV